MLRYVTQIHQRAMNCIYR